MSGEIPSLVDLQNTKVRIDHFAELIDGTPSGTSANPITGVTHPTYEKAIKDLGFKPGSGSFTTGFTINPGEYDVAWYDPVSNNWYSWDGVLPHAVAPGTDPTLSGSGYVPRTDVVLQDELAAKLGSLMIGFSRIDDVPRTVGDKLKDTPTANDYMLQSESNLALAINRAKADNIKALTVTADRSYSLSSAVELPDDFELLGYGRPSVVCSDIANIIRMNSRTKFSGFKLSGASPAVLTPHNGAVDVNISGNFFTGQNQIVLLLTCSNVTVENNIFDGTGYGVIQQAGYVSNNIRVVGNNARGMTGDFVEANSASVGTRNWQILHNIYDGAADWTTPATERRFVGITALEDVIIANNLVRNTAGDSAIHLEDALGRTNITGNIFVDCFAEYGCIYNLSSSDDMLVSQNWFVMTDAYAGINTTAIMTDSGIYSHRCKIESNIFYDVTSGGKKLNPAFLAFGGEFDFDGNWCVNTFDVVRFSGLASPRFSRNRGIGQLQRGIWADVGASGGAGLALLFPFS